MVDIELIVARFFYAFRVTTRNLLDFSRQRCLNFFSRLDPVALALAITTEVILVLDSLWFSSNKPKSKWTNFLARTIRS